MFCEAKRVKEGPRMMYTFITDFIKIAISLASLSLALYQYFENRGKFPG